MRTGHSLSRLVMVLLTVFLSLGIQPVPPIHAQSAPEPAAPPAAEPTGLGDLISRLEADEYRPSWAELTYLPETPAALQAPNRAHDLRAYFTPGGLVVIPRRFEGDTPPWRWQASLTGWGRDGTAVALPPGAPEMGAPTGALEEAVEPGGKLPGRVEYRRPLAEGGLPSPLEWYDNGPAGIVQGFTLEAAPTGAGALRLWLELGGDLAANPVSGQPGVVFHTPDVQAGQTELAGQVGLAYGGLLATDATGAALPAWVEVQDGRLSLFIDDAGAAYPLTVLARITGLSPAYDWHWAGEQAGNQAGFRVATAGDLNKDGFSDVVLGLPFYDTAVTEGGRVLVFYGSASGLRTTIGEDLHNDLQANAHFGWSVASAGDVDGNGCADLLVGMPEADAGGLVDAGQVWLYRGTHDGMENTGNLLGQGTVADARFGSSVAFAGDVNGDELADIIVGAPLFNGGQAEEGRVYVYHGVEGAQPGAPAWQAESNLVNASLGNSVATAGDVNSDGYADVIVAAHRYSHPEYEEGAVFVWYGSSNGVNNDVNGTPANAAWSQEGANADRRFGFSVSTAGDLDADGFADVIIGVPIADHGLSGVGLVYTFYGSAAGLEAGVDGWARGEGIAAHLGWSVATAGDVNGDGFGDVIAGSPDLDGTANQAGKAYLWLGPVKGALAPWDWSATGEGLDEFFGKSVATAGDVNGDGYSDVIVGAPGRAGFGEVFVYYGGVDGPEETASWSKRSNQTEAGFGFSAAGAGDVNGDGYADLIVGAPRWDDGQTDEGGAWVYLGAEGGLQTAPAWYKQSDHANTQFGYAVASAGDVDGDGLSDVIVGAPYWTDGQDQEGGAWVYRGGGPGVISTPYWYKYGNQVQAWFGYAVGSAGDVNGDGYSEVIVGGPKYDHGSIDEGMAWVYQGAAGGIHSAPDWSFDSDQTGALLGQAVGSAGDVNRDGYSDLIVGAPLWEDSLSTASEGRAWVFLGGPEGVSAAAAWHAESNTFNGQLGFSVASAGDVNGDGFSDVIVGGPYYGDDGLTSEGKVWVFHGMAGGVQPAAVWSKEAGQSDSYYGYSVSSAGDVNGDGYSDVVIGAPMMNDTVSDEGTARVFLGSAAGLTASPAWRGAGGQTLSWYGVSVASAGDVNGDGYAEIVVGAHDYNDVLVNEGRAWVYYGNGRPGAALRPRQRTHVGSPLAHLGRAPDWKQFQLELNYASPFGRHGMQPSYEIKKLSAVLTGSPTYSTGMYVSRPIGELKKVYHVGETGMVYHWRIRWQYSPASNPFMPASRWLSMPYHGWNEADLRLGGLLLYLPVIDR